MPTRCPVFVCVASCADCHVDGATCVRVTERFHYVLVVVDPTTSTILYFDSMPTQGEDALTRFLRNRCRAAQNASTVHTLTKTLACRFPGWDLSTSHEYVQTDSWSCGLWAVAVAFHCWRSHTTSLPEALAEVSTETPQEWLHRSVLLMYSLAVNHQGLDLPLNHPWAC